MRIIAWLALVPLAAACAGATSPGGASSTQQADGSDGGSCQYPAGVDVSANASGPGCFAHAPGQICQVSNGGTVLPDGGVSGGTETCNSICGPSEYGMTCNDSHAGPDPSLGCRIIPIPTPSCCAFYCCPCAS